MIRLHVTRLHERRVLIRFAPRWPFSLLLESSYQECWWTGRQWVDLDSNRPASRRIVDAIDRHDTRQAVGQRIAGLMRQGNTP